MKVNEKTLERLGLYDKQQEIEKNKREIFEAVKEKVYSQIDEWIKDSYTNNNRGEKFIDISDITQEVLKDYPHLKGYTFTLIDYNSRALEVMIQDYYGIRAERQETTLRDENLGNITSIQLVIQWSFL